MININKTKPREIINDDEAKKLENAGFERDNEYVFNLFCRSTSKYELIYIQKSKKKGFYELGWNDEHNNYDYRYFKNIDKAIKLALNLYQL